MLMIRKILFSILFFNLFLAGIHAQCTLRIDSVRHKNVSCAGFKDGSIEVFATGGTGSLSYSTGGVGAVLLPVQEFNDQTTVNNSSLAPTNKWWSPASCQSGAWFMYNQSEGCPSGSAKYTGKTFTFGGCFLRSPQINMNGIDQVKVSFKVSHSYTASRPKDNINFSVWVNGKYLSSATAFKVNGFTDKYLYFDKQRNCQDVEVTIDLSSVPSSNRSDFLFYINSDSYYSNSSPYFVVIDNVIISKPAAFQNSTLFKDLAPGSYNITVSDAAGCSTSSQVPVVVSEPPILKPIILANLNELSCGEFASYKWLLNGLPINGATGSKYTATQNGNYSVEVTDINGCSGTAEPYSFMTTKLYAPAGKILKAFPNPFFKSLSIEIPDNFREQVTELSLYDILGKRVSGYTGQKERIISLPTSDLPAGIYFLNIRIGDYQETISLVHSMIE